MIAFIHTRLRFFVLQTREYFVSIFRELNLTLSHALSFHFGTTNLPTLNISPNSSPILSPRYQTVEYRSSNFFFLLLFALHLICFVLYLIHNLNIYFLLFSLFFYSFSSNFFDSSFSIYASPRFLSSLHDVYMYF